MPDFKEGVEVTTLLESLGVTMEELLDIIRAAVGGRREYIPRFDPTGSGGQFAYIYGTRRIRATYLAQGWECSKVNNVEATYNPKTGIKLIYQSADRAADPDNDPVATNPKGSGSAAVVEMGQGEFWPEMRERELTKLNAPIWYLFVYAFGDDVRAELSRPKAIKDKQFYGFHDRIILVAEGDWQGIDITPDEEPLPDIDVDVTPKKG